jgi:hypothetical protein
MTARLLSRLTYANVMATIAVVLALGGTATAAGTLITGKNVKNDSISGTDIKNRTLGGTDVKDRSLLAKDFKTGQLPAGARGATGPAGARGPAGTTGLRGPSDVWHTSNIDYAPNIKTVTLSLPAGNYVVHGKMGAFNGAAVTETEDPSCQLYVATGAGYEDGFFAAPEDTETTLSLVTVLRFTTPQEATFFCAEPAGADMSFGRATLVATEVTTVHSQ